MALAGCVVFLLLKRLKVVLVFWVLVVVVEAGVRRRARVRSRRVSHRRLPARAGHHRPAVRPARTRRRTRRRGQLEAVTERGPGFVTASVADPFGNVLGIMYNRHYLDILATAEGAQ